MRTTTLIPAIVCLLALASLAGAQDGPAVMKLGGGTLELKAPANWTRKQPLTQIVEHEFAAPASQGDSVDGRLTVMAAGGSIDDNISRWYGQFAQPDGGSTKDRAKVKKLTAAGEEIHLVDI